MLAPAFLLGLLAIGLPIWLHRVARANPTHHPFASLMLLEASETQRTAKRTLRYWLLLAIRIALLVLLVLAFAGPLVTQRFVPQRAANARLHAIVLDASLSMQHGQRWQQAIAEARAVLDDLGTADRVMLATAAGRRVTVVHEAVSANSAGSVRAALDELTGGIERLDYGLAMSTAGSWLGTPRPPTVLHLISDLQRSASPLRFADLAPPADTQLMLHDVGREPAHNAYIESAQLASLDTRSLEVVVRGTADSVQQRQVILTIDGKEQGRRKVEIPPAVATVLPASVSTGEGGGQAEAELDAQVAAAAAPAPSTVRTLFANLTLSPGAHRLEVTLEPADTLPQDDRFHAVIQHADPKALLLERSANADDAAYFAAAISSLTAPRLKVERRVVQDLESGSLADYSVVVIPDVAALSDSAAARIRDYVASGGAVLATLGSADASSERSVLLEGLRIRETRSQTSGVGEVSSSHPILRDAGEWHRVRFFRQRRVQAADGDSVLIAHADGSALLIERTVGAGRLLLLTAPVERSWNDLAIHPLFVQFIAAAARYLIGTDASAASTTVGAVVSTGLTAATGGQIFDPQGRRVLELAQTAADRLVPGQTGFYEIRSTDGVRWLAVNVDARESDLTRLPLAFVQRWQALRLRPVAAAPAAANADSGTPRSLGPFLMLIAAMFVLAELLLANRYLAVRREVSR